jgi:hypothetical protein
LTILTISFYLSDYFLVSCEGRSTLRICPPNSSPSPSSGLLLLAQFLHVLGAGEPGARVAVFRQPARPGAGAGAVAAHGAAEAGLREPPGMDHHRRRPGRLCLRDPRGAARAPVACVEKRGSLGGTCLNVGCIPSKALLHASELLHEAQGNFAKMGIVAAGLKVDLDRMMAYKREVIESNTKGIEFLFKKNKVDYIRGWGEIAAPGEVRVGDEVHECAQHRHRDRLGAGPPAGDRDRRGAGRHLDRRARAEGVPKRLVVIGAGVIGLELGSVWARLGSEVTVVEYLDEITARPGRRGAEGSSRRRFKKQGLRFKLGAARCRASRRAKLTVRHEYRARADGARGEPRGRRGARGSRPARLHRPGSGSRASASRPSAAWSRPTTTGHQGRRASGRSGT